MKKQAKDTTLEPFTRLWLEENQNNFNLEPVLVNAAQPSKKRFGHGIDTAMTFSKDFHLSYYLPDSQVKKCAREGYDFYVKENGLVKLLTYIQKSYEVLLKQIKHLSSVDLAKLSNKELFKEYHTYATVFNEAMGCVVLTQPYWLAGVEKKLHQELSRSKAVSIMPVLTRSANEFIFSKENSLFKKSFSELLKAENTKINKTLADKILFREKKISQQSRNAAIKKYRLSKSAVALASILRTVAEARLKMRFDWMKAVYYNELFLVELKRRYKIPKQTLRLYDIDEFEALIKNGKRVNLKILQKRSAGFAKVLKAEKITTYTGAAAVDLVARTTKQKSATALKGSIACEGKATGPVVVFSYRQSANHAAKIKAMKPGSILVTEMTRPNIISAIKKAAAIVTDEGGITSHAAIISRELHKPCVIGTKHATEVLKDGDIVNVDATTGIVSVVGRRTSK